MKIDFIEVEGSLEIQGVFNYNGKDVDKKVDNHIAAKKNVEGIDYTSSRCIRHEMFRDIQPSQPRKKDFKEIDNFYVSLAASQIGLLRGLMSPEEGSNSLKRNSPLSVQDAYTNAKMSQIVFDQGTSSKPKEKDDKKSDTSIFSKDNAPLRDQSLKMFINISNLQFITQNETDYMVVMKKDEELFLEKLSANFESLLNKKKIFKFSDYNYISGLSEIKTRGLLLNDEETRALVVDAIKRLANIFAVKSGSYIKSRDLKVKLYEKNEIFDQFSVLQLDEKIKNAEFKKFYSEV